MPGKKRKPAKDDSPYRAQTKRPTGVNPLAGIYPALPRKKYQVILADPPWERSLSREDGPEAEGIPAFTVKLRDLKRLDVAAIADDNCLLFLWATGPQLASALELGAAWGFTYKTMAFVWDKQMQTPGRYTLSQTEYVLVFRKGKFPGPRSARNVRQLISAKRPGQNAKPGQVAAGIARMFPNQDKIALFYRETASGWDSWDRNTQEECFPIQLGLWDDLPREEV